MKGINYIHIIAVFGISLLQSCSNNKNNWAVHQDTEGVLLLEGSDSVLFYQRASKSREGKFERSNYVHPLYGVNGNVLTEDFPEDHLHHRGIFWAWHQLFIGKERIADAWALENFESDVEDVEVTTADKFSMIKTKVNWKSPLWLDDMGAKKTFVKEAANIKIFPKADNYRVIDFKIEIVSMEDSLSIGGSEDAKGYSGFSWRVKLPENVMFEGGNGAVTPTTLAVEAGSWINLSGSISSKGNEGIVVISHPTNPNHPQPWILRKERSMQNAAYPGRERVLIPRDKPLRLKYRMIVYEGTLTSERIKELFKF